MKKFLSIFYILVLLFFAKSEAHAASEFTTDFDSVYTISAAGEANVTHTITLKNNLANIYATDYTLATSGDHLSHITASDEAGALSVSSSQQGGTTTLHLLITHPAIGQDKVKTITINYQTTDVVEMIGSTTTINIPRLSRANEAESYTRTVKVEDLGSKPAIVYPPPNAITPVDSYTVYTFNGHPNDSLTLLFGTSVTYKLNLTYDLKNKELGTVDSELALPPDTDYQHVLLYKINPPPLNIRLDADGNWLARYSLRPQDHLEVTTELYVTVYAQPVLPDPSTTALEKSPHSQYWDTSASIVTDLAGQLKSPDNIYTYLVDNFTYNYGGITGQTKRLEAAHALASPTLVLCTEFTDTFVTLARVDNVPAREINGYGFTTDTTLHPQSSEIDVLHAWPEYYNDASKKWISVDPTWGNTTGGVDYFNKLDFSHITFVRHGVEDSYPLPAGAYKDSPSQKFVNVEIATTVPPEKASYTLSGNTIVNNGNVALINQTVTLAGHHLTIAYLPPYGSTSLNSQANVPLYDKIKTLCENLFSKFLRLLRVSM